MKTLGKDAQIKANDQKSKGRGLGEAVAVKFVLVDPPI